MIAQRQDQGCRRAWVALLTVIVAMGTLHCRGQDRAKRSATIVLSRYQAFLSAEPAERPLAIDALSHVDCGPKEVCQDRDICLTFATAIERAQHLTQKAKELGPESLGGNGAATKEQLAIIVGGADDATREAADAEPACKDALGRLFAITRR